MSRPGSRPRSPPSLRPAAAHGQRRQYEAASQGTRHRIKRRTTHPYPYASRHAPRSLPRTRRTDRRTRPTGAFEDERPPKIRGSTSPYPMASESPCGEACRMDRVKRPLTVRTAGDVSYSGLFAPVSHRYRRRKPPDGLPCRALRCASHRPQPCHSDRAERPEAAPKPSTSASVPSSVDSLAFTSHNRA
jgi:hypothetical protein